MELKKQDCYILTKEENTNHILTNTENNSFHWIKKIEQVYVLTEYEMDRDFFGMRTVK